MNFDLNIIPEDATVDEFNGKEIMEDIFKPFIGQCFLSEEEAFIFYKRYANKHGFSCRKSRFIIKNGEKKWRDFVCSCAGKPEEKLVDLTKQQRNRTSTKCECKAHVRIVLKKTFDIFPEEWQVVQFEESHNHNLLALEEVRFLPMNRTICKEDEERILLYKEGGLSVKQILRVMELERGVKHSHLPFLAKDVYNLLNRIGRKESENDAMDLVQFCKAIKDENPNFQYSFTIDEKGRLEHIFWSPSHCFEWYQKFGDVVVFDTTYKVNSYEMPFGMFVGIDNHGRTILYGCALIRNETRNTFSWLMKTFVSLMRKPPLTILTDQDPWMTEAIASEMPNTKHAFCIWHITSKFSGWFTSILRDQYSNWCSDFFKLYKLDTFMEFEQQWPLVISKYNMNENKHIRGLYEIRHFWVPGYLRHYFFGGMTTTGRSESINAFMKRFIASRSCFLKFMKQVDLAIEDIEHSQLHNTMLEKYRGSSLRSKSPLEEQAYVILTPFAFKMFQDQFAMSSRYKVLEMHLSQFEVQYFDSTSIRKHYVLWDGKQACCSCKHFEFWGILCRHILSVFLHKDCFEVPNHYFPLRWRRESAQVSNNVPLSLQEVVSSVDHEMNDSSNVGIVDYVHRPPQSKTKGRPSEKRMKKGTNSAKRVKTCSFCKIPNHTITTCPNKENMDINLNTNQSKRKKTAVECGVANPIFSMKY